MTTPTERDELYDLTATEVADEPLSTMQVAGAGLRAFGFIIVCLCLAAPLWFGVNAFVRASDNYFAGNGFTPISHPDVVGVQELTPARFECDPNVPGCFIEREVLPTIDEAIAQLKARTITAMEPGQ